MQGMPETRLIKALTEYYFPIWAGRLICISYDLI